MLSRLNMQAQGLETFFGELEAKIMGHLWKDAPCSITCVKKALAAERDYSFNTIMTVLNRLCDKGVVKKRKDGHATLFTPCEAKEEFLKNAARALMRLFFGKSSPLAMPHFLDALHDISEEDLATLKKHITRRRV